MSAANNPTNVPDKPKPGADPKSDRPTKAPDKRTEVEPGPEPVEPVDPSGDEASDRAS